MNGRVMCGLVNAHRMGVVRSFLLTACYNLNALTFDPFKRCEGLAHGEHGNLVELALARRRGAATHTL